VDMLAYRSASPGYWTAWLLPVAVVLSGITSDSVYLIVSVALNTIVLSVLHSMHFDLTVTLARIRGISLLFAVTVFCRWVYGGGKLTSMLS